MRATYITACAIGALIAIWLATGQLREEPEPPAVNIAEQNQRVALLQEERPATRVRVATIHASKQDRLLAIRGRTQNKRSVTVQSQIGGLIISRPVERGDTVEAGQLLCEISIEDRDAALRDAKAMVYQARIEFEGSQRLSKEGLQSQTAIAQAKARLATAIAQLERAQLDKSRLKIEAPFGGVIEDVHQEVGQLVTPGSDCATLVDLDPMLLKGQISENELPFVEVGQRATATLPSGEVITGLVTFVAKTSSDATRTYAIEINVPNAEFKIPSGITAQINLPVESVVAQKISPALLVLDDEGHLGVRTVDASNVVQFTRVQIVQDEADGIWVRGLPDIAQVIVVGQQLVVAGEQVDATHSALNVVSAEEPVGNTL